MSYRGIPAGYEDEDDDQKITIVPDITTAAGINGEDFDKTLSADDFDWFIKFKQYWNSYKKRSPGVLHSLNAKLSANPNPLVLALKLFANCPGCNNLKNKNLALYILETTCDLCEVRPDIAANCDDNTRMIAFNFVKTCGIVSIYKAVMATYELNRISALLVPKIEELISQGHVKDAAYWAMHLKVTHVFGIYDIVFPLILQDKVYLAEEYLNVAKNLILPTVQFLDSLLTKEKTVYEQCDEIITQHKYKDVQDTFLTYKPMSKLVTRLAKKYKISAQLTPNLNFSKTCSYIHFLWHKYCEGGMSCEAWRELVRDAASTKPLQIDLIATIAASGDLDEAVHWANFYNIPVNECPEYVRNKMQNRNTERSLKVTNGGATSKTNRSNSFTTEKYLTLNLPTDCVILVDIREKFIDMISYLETQQFIAFDSEWKPSVCNQNTISLLQLATMERVFLLDCLSPHLSDDLWHKLGQRVFNNLEILKIGFSLRQDLSMLQKSLPFQLNMQSKTCYLDLRDFWLRLKCLQIVNFPYGNGRHGESLCVLTELCLGKKLDKSNQCSNWANRPLRHDQIVYAALDAHCLLQVYEVFSEILLGMGFEMDKVIDEMTTSKTGYMSHMKRVISEKSTNINKFAADCSANNISNAVLQTNNIKLKSGKNFRFLSDRMLFGLSKELRKLGLDCVNINRQSLDNCIELARRENRYVLTRDTRYTDFANKLPQGQCLDIPTDSSVVQILNLIRLLNIKIFQKNLFTRCIVCNSNEFILVYKHEMHQLLHGHSDPCQADGSTAAACDNPYERTFQLMRVNDHIMNTKTTYRGTKIRMQRIKPHILQEKEHIFICDKCGDCTWDGAHSIHHSIMEIIKESAKQTEEA